MSFSRQALSLPQQIHGQIFSIDLRIPEIGIVLKIGVVEIHRLVKLGISEDGVTPEY